MKLFFTTHPIYNMKQTILQIISTAVFIFLSFTFLDGYFRVNYVKIALGGFGLLLWIIFVNYSNIYIPQIKRRYSDYDGDYEDDSSAQDLRNAAQETGNRDWSASSIA